jgi:hypothetical protein
VWLEVWKIIESILIFSVRLSALHAETRQFARKQIVDVCVLGHDDHTLLQMISTPDFDLLALEMWLMEIEDPECQHWDGDHCSSMAAFLDLLFSSVKDQSDGKQRLEAFLAPMNGDMTYIASTALKHLHDAFYRVRPNLDCVLWNTHIMTVLLGIFDPLGNVLHRRNTIFANRFSEREGYFLCTLESHRMGEVYRRSNMYYPGARCEADVCAHTM